MKRWLPHPLLAAFLLLAWLLLARNAAAGTVVLGVVVAFGLSLAYARLQPPRVRMRHVGTLLRLLARVLADIVRSNLAVAWTIVTGRRMRAGFVTIPLQLTNPYGLAMLACIITSTPGTIWVGHDSARRELVIHVLDLVDEGPWISGIKQRYERPLLEIFR